MLISELFEDSPNTWNEGRIVRGEITAFDSMTGKTLFNTRKNSDKHIKKFFIGILVSIYPDIDFIESGNSHVLVPYIKCFVEHDSWKEND